jgi:LacI family transcriptional regulator, galactose operon repressor
VTATIRDVAALAGVSTATVSRVLSGASPARPQTAHRVLAAARQLDYRPSGVARSLQRRRTRTLGLIITDIENPFYPELVRAVEDAALAHDHTVLLCNGAEDPDRERRALEELAERRVDGIVIASGRLTARYSDWLASAPTPIVLVNSHVEGLPVASIVSDNRAGGRLGAEHLIALGHRRIGYLTAPPANAAAGERLAGVHDALRAAGLDPAAMPLEEGDGHVAGGELAMTRLIHRAPELTGILCYNDLTAIGALRALRAVGRRVPAEMSVVGFDGIEAAAYVDPPLTTIEQQTTEMGRWAVDRLIGRLHGGSPEALQSVLLPVSLRAGGSSGPPPGPRGGPADTTHRRAYERRGAGNRPTRRVRPARLERSPPS